jgi:hypothetical protein
MDETKWYLRKSHDGSEFGPIAFQQLRQWAAEAQVSPLDRVSTDAKTWLKAPMVPELEMDYLVEVGEDQFYGPTTVGALREFLTAGEITTETVLTNCKDTTSLRVRDLLTPAEIDSSNDANNTRAGHGIRINLQQRIRELEERLEQERRGREAAEHLVQKLEAQIVSLTGSR